MLANPDYVYRRSLDFIIQLTAAVIVFAVVVGPTIGRATVKSLSNLPSHDVYVVAHQDDWQLFIGDVVVERVQNQEATFIYLTAGDDGRDSSYWRARERAALASTRVAIGNQGNPTEPSCAQVTVRQHAVRKCVIGRTESYFLRLPDGRRDGAGYARYGSQSMRRLRSRKTSTITAVDGSATYRGWEDLVSSVSELLDGATGRALNIHTTDPRMASNPHDHADHRMAGLLVDELRKRMGFGARYYVGYALATRAPNRTNIQAREKTEVFLAYDQDMMKVNKTWSAYREHPAFYSECMLRTYARTPHLVIAPSRSPGTGIR